MTTRWEEAGRAISRDLQAAQAARWNAGRDHLERVMSRIAHGEPRRRPTSAVRGATAAPVAPDRVRAWDRRRRDLHALLDGIVARAPAVYVAPPTRPMPTVALFTDPLPTPEPPVMWSPTHVLGFRAWRVMKTGLNGVKKRWKTSTYEAGCIRDGRVEVHDDGVPHTGGECTEPPCGIYALKHPRALTDAAPPGWDAFGLVALSGKVVEHEIGYRAAAATAVTVAVYADDHLHRISGDNAVAALFRNPRAALASCDDREPVTRSQARQLAAAYLDEMRLLCEAVGGLG